jgi:hypothetical protein
MNTILRKIAGVLQQQSQQAIAGGTQALCWLAEWKSMQQQSQQAIAGGIASGTACNICSDENFSTASGALAEVAVTLVLSSVRSWLWV